jgi:hypothetical protein
VPADTAIEVSGQNALAREASCLCHRRQNMLSEIQFSKAATSTLFAMRGIVLFVCSAVRKLLRSFRNQIVLAWHAPFSLRQEGLNTIQVKKNTSLEWSASLHRELGNEIAVHSWVRHLEYRGHWLRHNIHQ